MTIKSVLCVGALAVLMQSGAACAGTEEDLAQTYVEFQKHTLMGTKTVLIELDERVRLKASLEACELEALAEVVGPSKDDLSAAAMKYVKETPGAMALGIALVAAIESSTLSYQFGFGRAFSNELEGSKPAVRQAHCAELTRIANQSLTKAKKSDDQ